MIYGMHSVALAVLVGLVLVMPALYLLNFKRALKIYAVVFTSWFLFTGLVPCKYSSYGSVRATLKAAIPFASVIAQDVPLPEDSIQGPTAPCNNVESCNCFYPCCNVTYFGCGWGWLGPCTCWS